MTDEKQRDEKLTCRTPGGPIRFTVEGEAPEKVCSHCAIGLPHYMKNTGCPKNPCDDGFEPIVVAAACATCEKFDAKHVVEFYTILSHSGPSDGCGITGCRKENNYPHHVPALKPAPASLNGCEKCAHVGKLKKHDNCRAAGPGYEIGGWAGAERSCKAFVAKVPAIKAGDHVRINRIKCKTARGPCINGACNGKEEIVRAVVDDTVFIENDKSILCNVFMRSDVELLPAAPAGAIENPLAKDYPKWREKCRRCAKATGINRNPRLDTFGCDDCHCRADDFKCFVQYAPMKNPLAATHPGWMQDCKQCARAMQNSGPRYGCPRWNGAAGDIKRCFVPCTPPAAKPTRSWEQNVAPPSNKDCPAYNACWMACKNENSDACGKEVDDANARAETAEKKLAEAEMTYSKDHAKECWDHAKEINALDTACTNLQGKLDDALQQLKDAPKYCPACGAAIERPATSTNVFSDGVKRDYTMVGGLLPGAITFPHESLHVGVKSNDSTFKGMSPKIDTMAASTAARVEEASRPRTKTIHYRKPDISFLGLGILFIGISMGFLSILWVSQAPVSLFVGIFGGIAFWILGAGAIRSSLDDDCNRRTFRYIPLHERVRCHRAARATSLRGQVRALHAALDASEHERQLMAKECDKRIAGLKARSIPISWEDRDRELDEKLGIERAI